MLQPKARRMKQSLLSTHDPTWPSAIFHAWCSSEKRESMRSVCSGRHHSAGFTQGMRCLFSRSKSHTHKTAINGKTASLCEALSKERTLPQEQSTFTSTFTTFDLLLKWHGVDRVINSRFYEPEWLPGGTLHTAQSKQKEKRKCAQTAVPNK